MPRTTLFDPGTVVLVRFPFTDLMGTKQRPAVVLSTRKHQRRERDVIVAAVSGQRVDHAGPFDHLVQDWEAAGLLMPSVVRCAKIVTLEGGLVRRALGALTSRDMDGTRQRLLRALGSAA